MTRIEEIELAAIASFVDIAEAEFESEIGETHRLKENIIRSLEQLGIKTVALTQKEILNQIYAQWNPQRHRQIELGYYDPLNKVINF